MPNTLIGPGTRCNSSTTRMKLLSRRSSRTRGSLTMVSSMSVSSSNIEQTTEIYHPLDLHLPHDHHYHDHHLPEDPHMSLEEFLLLQQDHHTICTTYACITSLLKQSPFTSHCPWFTLKCEKPQRAGWVIIEQSLRRWIKTCLTLFH